MSRPRFTLGWLMVAVAVMAIAISVLIATSRRHARFAAYAKAYARLASKRGWVLEEFQTPRSGQSEEDREARRHFAPKLEREVRRYETMHSKYAYAARYPWLPVAPDPPEPE